MKGKMGEDGSGATGLETAGQVKNIAGFLLIRGVLEVGHVVELRGRFVVVEGFRQAPSVGRCGR